MRQNITTSVRPCSLRRLIPTLVVGTLAPVLLSVPATAATHPAPAFTMATAPQVQLRRHDTPVARRPAGAPRRYAADGTQSTVIGEPPTGPDQSTWQITYTGFDAYPQAQAAFQTAVDIWKRIVKSTVPIKVDANFEALPTNVLGSAGASTSYSGVGDGQSLYPSALADALYGQDIAPLVPGAPASDITAHFTNQNVGFYFGTDGAPPAGQIDFESVVLHELGHGLGFFGSANVSGGQGSYYANGAYRYRFDRFTYDAASAGNAILGYATPSPALATVLQGNSQYWGGTVATATNGSARPRMYAPASWEPGSSYSHLNEATYVAGDPNSLMTPAIGAQEAIHSPGPIVAGVFNDLGWSIVYPGLAALPGAPASVTATAGVSSATVQWAAAAANNSAITGYTVTANPGGLTATVDGSSSQATVPGLAGGTAYTFTVRATNGVGQGPSSSASNSVTPTAAPGPPGSVSASAGNAAATVTWTAASPHGAAISGYTVTSSPATATQNLSGSALQATFSGLTNGQSYSFTVQAANSVGAGAPATSNSVVPVGPPNAPTGVGANPGNTSALVTWTPSTTNGTPVTGYTVTSSPGGLTATAAAGASSATVNGLSNGTAYTFTVVASSAAGPSAASSASSSVVPAAVPDAPTDVAAVRGNATATVSWTAAAGNGSAVTQYVVTSSPGGVTAATSGTSTSVGPLANGTAYTFTVKATNDVGQGPSSAASNAVVPAAAPGAPGNVTAARGNGSATVTWSAAASNGDAVTQYTVTSSPATVTRTTSGATTLSFPGLANGTGYTFTVTATNGVGTGPASSPSNSVVPATTPSAVPTVAATAGDHAATVTWSAAPANGSTITGYVVTPSGGAPVTVANPGATSAPISGLTNGTGYTFTVHATSDVGPGPDSAASNAVTPSGVPLQVGTVTATRAGDGSIALSWPVAGPNGSPLTDHRITVSPGGAVILTGSTTNSYAVTGLTNGTSYSFTVSAKNANGFGSASAPSDSIAPAVAPSAVPSVSASGGDHQATVSWSAPATNGSTITGYVVTPSGGTPVTVADPTASSALVTGLLNGVSYTFTVYATSDVGSGPDSSPSSSVVPSGVPLQVQNVAATAGDGQAFLAWDAAGGNGATVDYYEITTIPGGAVTQNAATATTIGGLSNGTGYTFVVRAHNANGLGAGSASTGAVVPAGPPAQVGGVTATAGNGQATVQWSPAGTNGAALTHYTVVASPADAGPVTVAPDQTSATVSGLANDTAYTFTVYATNAGGDGATSDPSGSVLTDGTAPVLAVTSTPPGYTAATTATFGYTAIDPAPSSAAVTVTCALDTAALASCPASPGYSGLSEATHTFTIRATDSVGNASTASYTWTVDHTAPTLTVNAVPAFGLGSTAPVTFSGTDALAGIASYGVRTRKAAYNGALGSYGATVTTTAKTYAPAAVKGYTYCISVQATDKAGNVSAWSADKCTSIPLDDRSLAPSPAADWKRLTSAAVYAGTYTSTAKSGKTLKLASAAGRRIAVVATTCAACGSVKVTFGGVTKTLSLVSTSTASKKVLVLDFGAVRSGAVTITTTVAKTVSIDGLGASRF